jgi:F0F1-type ATP synthase assembly protein I
MSTDQDPKPKKPIQAYAQAGHYLGLGMQFAVAILLGLWGGWWLDSKLSVSPLFLLLGALLGGAAGFYALYRAMVEEQEKERQRKRR